MKCQLNCPKRGGEKFDNSVPLGAQVVELISKKLISQRCDPNDKNVTAGITAKSG